MALRMATSQSLVIVDEFGKGTAEADGIALLAASVEDFAQRGRKSPTVFLSTHFYSLRSYLEVTDVIKLQVIKNLFYIMIFLQPSFIIGENWLNYGGDDLIDI